jgi:hypothetical protein
MMMTTDDIGRERTINGRQTFNRLQVAGPCGYVFGASNDATMPLCVDDEYASD